MPNLSHLLPLLLLCLISTSRAWHSPFGWKIYLSNANHDLHRAKGFFDSGCRNITFPNPGHLIWGDDSRNHVYGPVSSSSRGVSPSVSPLSASAGTDQQEPTNPNPNANAAIRASTGVRHGREGAALKQIAENRPLTNVGFVPGIAAHWWQLYEDWDCKGPKGPGGDVDAAGWVGDGVGVWRSYQVW